MVWRHCTNVFVIQCQGLGTLFQEKCLWIYSIVIFCHFLLRKSLNDKEMNKTPISTNLGSMINRFDVLEGTGRRNCRECFVFFYTAIVVDSNGWWWWWHSNVTSKAHDGWCLYLFFSIFFGHHSKYINSFETFSISQKFSRPVPFLCSSLVNKHVALSIILFSRVAALLSRNLLR
jgi:hypothetical protein